MALLSTDFHHQQSSSPNSVHLTQNSLQFTPKLYKNELRKILQLQHLSYCLHNVRTDWTSDFAEVFDAWPEHPRATRNWSHQSSASMSEHFEISFERLHLDSKREKVDKNCSHTSFNRAGRKHKMLPFISVVVNLHDRMPPASSNGTFFRDLFCSCTLKKKCLLICQRITDFNLLQTINGSLAILHCPN